MNLILDTVREIGGTGITLVATLAVILVTRFILNRSVEDKRSLPYHRQIVTLVLSLVGLFVAVALLPLPPNVTAQILSALGILLSAVLALSSTTFVGNAMSGIMLRLMKGFRAGDFIRFDDILGRCFGPFMAKASRSPPPGWRTNESSTPGLAICLRVRPLPTSNRRSRQPRRSRRSPLTGQRKRNPLRSSMLCMRS